MSAPAASTAATTDALVAAATAAAAQLPAGQALALGPTDGSAAPEGTSTGVVVAFTGATSGTLVVVLSPALEAALAEAEGGPLPVADAVAPALQAALDAVGPAVPSPAEQVAVAELLARGDIAWAPLLEGADVAAWVGLAVPAGVEPAAAEAAAGPVPTQRTEAGGLALLRDVEMVLTVELGRTRMSVRELLSLAPGSVVELDRAAGAPADLMVNGRLLARGEVVVVDEDYGLRITQIIEPGAEA